MSTPLHKWRRRIAVSAGLIVLAAGIYLIGIAKPGRTQADFVTVKVDRGRIAARVTASGTLSALVTVQVGSQVSGRIQSLHADFNSPVTKGQVIAKIDPRLFEAALEQARANLAAAQGHLARAQVQAADAERQAQRAETLAHDKLINQSERDTVRSNADAAKAGVAAAEGTVAQARAALSEAQINLAYTTIVSPTNGVVISRNVDVGQTVAATLQAPILFVIAQDLRQMQVDTNIAESDIGKLAEGMPAIFTVDAYPGERFAGVIRQIRNAPLVIQNVVTYDAVISVENPELKLKPGMTANVTFAYADRPDVLRVPSAALRFRLPPELLPAQMPLPPRGERGQRGQRMVWVLRDGRPQPVPVRIGISDGALTEIVEGELKGGDELIADIRIAAKPPPPAMRLF